MLDYLWLCDPTCSSPSCRAPTPPNRLSTRRQDRVTMIQTTFPLPPSSRQGLTVSEDRLVLSIIFCLCQFISREYDRHPHLKYSSIFKESLQLAVKACLAFSATSSAAHTFLVPPLQVQSLTIASRVNPGPRNQPWSYWRKNYVNSDLFSSPPALWFVPPQNIFGPSTLVAAVVGV